MLPFQLSCSNPCDSIAPADMLHNNPVLLGWQCQAGNTAQPVHKGRPFAAPHICYGMKKEHHQLVHVQQLPVGAAARRPFASPKCAQRLPRPGCGRQVDQDPV